jgi:carboxylate-amine ligase
VRPLLAGLLPRQGVPPAISSWDAFADDLAWGATSGSAPEFGHWWWELRPHAVHGTLEVRVPDVQPTLTAAAAVASVVHALVRHLCARLLDGEHLPVPPTWRIAENRWSALRDGVHGCLADLGSGEPVPTVTRLHRMLDEIEHESPSGLDGARALVEHPTVDALRAAGVDGALPWLAEAFTGAPAAPA